MDEEGDDSGDPNYDPGTKKIKIQITKPEHDLANAQVTGVQKEYLYNGHSLLDPIAGGEPIEKVTVTLAGVELDREVDYDDYLIVREADGSVGWHVVGSVYEAPGNYAVDVYGIGQGYYGQVFADYSIVEEFTHPAASYGPGWHRVAGNSAYDTMEEVSKSGWSPDETTTVVLATGENFPDALAAAGAAGFEDAPVLITKTSGGKLSEQAKNELARLQPDTIVAVGGIYAMPNSVVDQALDATGAKRWERLAGSRASDTAVALNNAYNGTCSDTAFLATSLNFPDALSAAPVSYANRIPIYLVDNMDTISEATLASMKECGISKVVVLGGKYCVSDAVKAKINAIEGLKVVDTLWGNSAYETSKAIAEYGLSSGMTTDKMGVACGLNYPDALTGAAYCGKNDSIMALADSKDYSTCLSLAQQSRDPIDYGFVFGGTYAVPEEVLSAFKSAA